MSEHIRTTVSSDDQATHGGRGTAGREFRIQVDAETCEFADPNRQTQRMTVLTSFCPV
jgi:hypothetical protein